MTPAPSAGSERGVDRHGSARWVSLIASRELRYRLTSKAYLVTTALFVVAVVVGGVVLHAVGASTGSKTIGVVAGAARLTPQLEQTAQGLGLKVETRELPSSATGDELLRDGDIDAAITTVSPRLGVAVKDRMDPTLEPLFRSLAQQLALAQAVTTLGGNPAQVAQQMAQAAPEITPLEPVPAVDGAQIVAGYVAGILLFLALMTTGQLVAQGVVEEKSSRVVELLLATVRPWQLMAGKVLGIGLVGLLQVALVVGAGVATAASLGLVDTSSLDLGATAVWAIVWFAIGFASYALVLAALASLVSRQEDVASVIAPVTAVMVVPYIIAVSVGPWAPDSPLVATLSYIPFCAPLVMPVRIALGAVAGWQILVAVAMSLALLPLLVWLAGRIYSAAVLHSGSRVNLGDALRGT